MSSKLDSFDWSTWKPTEEATLLFAFDDKGRVLLIHKKRGLGKGKINGPGGRLEPGETPVQAAVRETSEEVGLEILDPQFCGTLHFHFVDGYNLTGYIYKAYSWRGDPIETDEALPEWFSVDAIPYERMWADDLYWFPLLLDGIIFEGKFVFDGDTMLSKSIETSGI